MVACADRSFGSQAGQCVGLDEVAVRAQLLKRKVGEANRARIRFANNRADDMVRVAKRRALLYQVFGEVGRFEQAVARSLAHRFDIELQVLADAFHGAQAGFEGIDSIKERHLVFLIVAIVGERLRFHDGEQRHQMPVHARRLAANQLRHVRVLLLRHDARSGGEAISEFDKAEALRRPENQFFAPARQMHHQNRGARREFNEEVAVAHRIK